MSVIVNIASAEVRDAAPTLEGEVLTRPALLKTDGENLTYACDVKIGGYDDPLRSVPIANGARDLCYAEAGAAVTLTRSRGGKYEITGYAKKKPGTRTRIAVNLDTLVAGDGVSVGLSSRPLTWEELGTIGGGWGVAPWGGVAIFRGDTLIEVR